MEARLNNIKRKVGSKPHKDGRPIRPLTAYQIFVHLEKKAKTNNESEFTTGSFSSLSGKWKNVCTALKLELEALSKLDKERYNRENREWKENMLKEAQASLEDSQVLDPSNKSVSSHRTSGSVRAIPALPFPTNHEILSAGNAVKQPSENKKLFLNNSFEMADNKMEVDQPVMPPADTSFMTRPLPQATEIRFPPRPTKKDTQHLRGYVQGCKFQRDSNPTVYTDQDGNTFKSDDYFQHLHTKDLHDPSFMRGYYVGSKAADSSPFADCNVSSLESSAGVHFGVGFQSNATTSQSDFDETAMDCEDKSQGMMSEKSELRYMRGYIQGYKAWTELNPTLYFTKQDDNTLKRDNYLQEVKDGDHNDPPFVCGYNEGFKAASDMWSKFK